MELLAQSSCIASCEIIWIKITLDDKLMLPADPTKLPAVFADLEDESNYWDGSKDFDIMLVPGKLDLVKNCSFTKLHQTISAVFIIYFFKVQKNVG